MSLSLSLTPVTSLAFLSIPWDLLAASDRAAIAWASAALAASVPAALAALLWVQAWRGSARFAPPRCSACRAELLARDRRLPDQCPECGRVAVVNGEPVVDFALRRWTIRGASVRFLAGSAAFGAAIAAAWLAGNVVGILARESAATARVGAITSTLTAHRSHRAITDALRFAADSAAADAAVRDEAVAALDAYEAGEIPAGYGLALLLDRHDDEAARAIVIDLVGSLAAAHAIDGERAMRLLRRVRGTPMVSVTSSERGGDAGTNEASLLVRVATFDATIRPTVQAVTELATGTAPTGATQGATSRGEELLIAHDAAREASEGSAPGGWVAEATARAPASPTSSVAVRAMIEWLAPASDAPEASDAVPGDTTPAPASAPASTSASGGPRLQVEVVERLDPNGVTTTPPASPFLARDLRPRVTVEPVGAISLVTVRLRATTLPGWRLAGSWRLTIGEQSVPVRATGEGNSLQFTTVAFVSLLPEAFPPTLALVFTPEASVGPATGPAERPGFSGLPRWPSEFRIPEVAWSRFR